MDNIMLLITTVNNFDNKNIFPQFQGSHIPGKPEGVLEFLTLNV